MKVTFDSGELDTLTKEFSKPVYDGIVKFFKDVSTVIDESKLPPATLKSLMLQAISLSTTEFLVLLDRLYFKTQSLSLVWALKILHDLSHDALIKYSIDHRSAEVKALTYCSRIDLTQKDKSTMDLLHAGTAPLLKSLILKKFSQQPRELQFNQSSPIDFTWRFQTWLHSTVKLHLMHPDAQFDAIDLDEPNRRALRHYIHGDFTQVKDTLEASISRSTHHQNLNNALLLACSIMQRKIPNITDAIVIGQQPAILGLVFNLRCSQSAKNHPNQSALHIMVKCHKGKRFLYDLLQLYPDLINSINPAMLCSIDPKTDESILYWLSTDLEIEDATEEVNNILHDHPPFGIFHNMTAAQFNIPKAQLSVLHLSTISGLEILGLLLEKNPLIAKYITVQVLCARITADHGGDLVGTSALQMLCYSEIGIKTLLALIKAKPQLAHELWEPLQTTYQKSTGTNNATSEARSAINHVFEHETLRVALAESPLGRELLAISEKNANLVDACTKATSGGDACLNQYRGIITDALRDPKSTFDKLSRELKIDSSKKQPSFFNIINLLARKLSADIKVCRDLTTKEKLQALFKDLSQALKEFNAYVSPFSSSVEMKCQ